MRGLRVATVAVLLSAFSAHSAELVLSQSLAIDYPEPELISHTGNMLILKYDDWVMSHQVVDPTAIYARLDLSGVEEQYIKSIFLLESRKSLPKWLRTLAEEQAEQFGLPQGAVTTGEVGAFQLLGTYNKNNGEGYLYLFDRAAIHNLTVQGSHEQYREVINSIRER